MPPHIIIMGTPLPIMVIICLQHCIIMSFMAGSMGVISQVMPLAVMVQVILHIIIGIIMPPIGIPPIMGIIPFIIGIIPDIIGFIIGIMLPVIGIGIIAGIAIGFMVCSFSATEKIIMKKCKLRGIRPQEIQALSMHFPPKSWICRSNVGRMQKESFYPSVSSDILFYHAAILSKRPLFLARMRAKQAGINAGISGGTRAICREVADIGRGLGIPLIIDNTVAPLLARPIDHGAAIVAHSATKYIGGHGTTLGGLIVDSGTFPWEDFPERHKLLMAPDPSYNGRTWVDIARPYGPIAYIFAVRAGLLRDFGPAIAPQNAFQLIQGLETLPLRIACHSENASRVADFLSKHPKVETVIFPGLQTGEARRRADEVLHGGYSGIVGFELRGGEEAGRRFIDALQLFLHLANIGDAHSSRSTPPRQRTRSLR